MYVINNMGDTMSQLCGTNKYILPFDSKHRNQNEKTYNSNLTYEITKSKDNNGNKADVMDLSNRELTNLKPCNKKQSVNTLKLNGNYLKVLPFHLTCFKQLKELYLQHNNFEYIPVQIWSFKSLEILDLSFNSISTIPNDIGDGEHIKELNLSYNKLCGLPYNISLLDTLTKLDLEGNYFMQIPPSLLYVKQLKILQLNRNQISYLPKKLSMLTELQELHLLENPILSVHTNTISYLINLQTLKVSDQLRMQIHCKANDKVILRLPDVPRDNEVR